MDSLLANYASSDEEEDHKPSIRSSSTSSSSLPKPKPKPKPSSLFNSLPPPKQEPHDDKQDIKPNSTRSFLFSSLPKPKHEDNLDIKPPSSSVFSSLPPPKSQIPKKPSSSSQIPKRVVQFKPPVFSNPTLFDDDDDKEEELRRRRKAAEASSAQPLSVTSFLSAIPAPRNSGVSSGLGSGVGSGRRAIVETESVKVETDVGLDQSDNVVSYSYDDQQSSFDTNGVSYEGGYGGGGEYEGYQYGGVEHNVDSGVQLQGVVSGSDASGYGGYSGYAGNHGGSHGNEWGGVSQAALMGVSGGKRRRNDVPTEIVEVKQDELMKNRPREDQAKATGIAFGPSYQPVSTKGKPTKLHKRKHQIGSLYFDMKQKEMELQERRSKGFLTKAETQAKYGW